MFKILQTENKNNLRDLMHSLIRGGKDLFFGVASQSKFNREVNVNAQSVVINILNITKDSHKNTQLVVSFLISTKLL